MRLSARSKLVSDLQLITQNRHMLTSTKWACNFELADNLRYCVNWYEIKTSVLYNVCSMHLSSLKLNWCDAHEVALSLKFCAFSKHTNLTRVFTNLFHTNSTFFEKPVSIAQKCGAHTQMHQCTRVLTVCGTIHALLVRLLCAYCNYIILIDIPSISKCTKTRHSWKIILAVT